MGDIERMTVALPTEMAVLVKSAVDSGDYASVSEVFRDALRSWKYRRSMQFFEEEEIRKGIAQGIEDLAAGRTKHAEDILKRLEAKYRTAG
jgi:antitoxin ParD1/3/4